MINMFSGDYELGKLIKCLACDNLFQHIECPTCQDSLYFEGQYQIGCKVSCVCKITFQHFTCPHCHYPKYHILANPDTKVVKPGSQLKCTECEKEFYYSVCPHCNALQNEKNFAPVYFFSIFFFSNILIIKRDVTIRAKIKTNPANASLNITSAHSRRT